MGVLGNLLLRAGKSIGGNPQILLPGESAGNDSEIGRRPTPENMAGYLYRTMWVDADLRATILDIRRMDRLDTRVKKIHKRTASAIIKGGLKLQMTSSDRRITRAWEQFCCRLKLDRHEKLESDARGLVMEGNLPIQWVLDGQNRVAAGVRMPSETIKPVVGPNGLFLDPQIAYEQYDLTTGAKLAQFALWQLTVVRLTPDNYDDLGSLGRPYLDAGRAIWRKITMTEEDLVIRRRMRAPLRVAHSLEGASIEELEAYRQRIEQDQAQGNTTDYYMNKRGAVTPIQGDASLDQIADVSYLLDTFFAGAPAPKGLFGYTTDLARDILEDLTRDFFEEIDALQDTLSSAYQMGFELDLLLQGINPFESDLQVVFAERRTETPNQAADRALKYQAMGASRTTVFETAGINPEAERDRLEDETDENDPYPVVKDDEPSGGRPRVSITPGARRKGESGTAISSS